MRSTSRGPSRGFMLSPRSRSGVGSNPARSAPAGSGAARAGGEEASWVEARPPLLHLPAPMPCYAGPFREPMSTLLNLDELARKVDKVPGPLLVPWPRPGKPDAFVEFGTLRE